MQFASLVYGPGLPPSGSRLAVRLDSFHLTLTLTDNRPLSVPLTQVRVAVGGFNDTVWRFEWSDAEGRWAVTLDDVATQQALLAKPPAALAQALASVGKKQRRTRTRTHLGIGALGLWFALPVLLLIALLWNASNFTGWIAAKVPLKTEQKLGDMVWKAQKAQLRLVENTAANEAVATIGAKLTQGSRYSYRWFVARDNSINAFAIPGGTVVVHTGLIEAAKTPEELAGVLAHEVQHIEQRHSLRAMAQSLGTMAGLGMVFGDVSGIAQIAASLSQLSYSRDAEREADARGLAVLKAAAIDPQGMVRMFETLGKESEGLNPPAMLSSHPATAERIARLKTAIAEAGSWPVQPLALDWAAVQASVR
ncbi:MAG: M48 family metallopeptidase [Stagnimonas sp.]|nr:M48 family metallopeptidase [Stagnimonas sp.]